MKRMISCVLIVFLSVTVLFCKVQAQTGALQPISSSNGKMSANTAGKSPTRAQEYEKLRMKALKVYYDPKEASFKRQVDEEYRRKQREHGDYALAVNLGDKDHPQLTRGRDKLEVEEVLYDNLLAQEYLNRLGQSLVPKDSKHLYAFKIILNPYPEARALSTGTIYVSTGLLSLVDNEAQLAYILAHEIAHVEKNHWFEDVMIERLVDTKKERQRKITKFILFTAANMARPFSGWTGVDQYVFRIYARYGLPSLVKLATPKTLMAWDKVQEDDADRLAMKYMLERNYDPREVKTLYANLYGVSNDESHLQFGFTATSERIVERAQTVQTQLDWMTTQLANKSLTTGANLAVNINSTPERLVRRGASLDRLEREIVKATEPGKFFNASKRPAPKITPLLQNEINKKLAQGSLVASGSEFAAMMGIVKRDNGIRAFQSDLFKMAHANLAEALAIRNNDPLAHYYDGRIWMQTARSADEKRAGLEAFRRAVKLDSANKLPELRLHLALALIQSDRQNARQEVAALVKEYARIYKATHNGASPPDVDAVNEYFRDAAAPGNRRVLTASTKPQAETSPQAKPSLPPTGGKKVEAPPAPEKKLQQAQPKQKLVKKRPS